MQKATLKAAIAAIAVAIVFATALASAQTSETLAKIQSSGKAVLGVRESSPPMAYSLGPGKYVGYQVELCEQLVKAIAPNATIDYLAVTPQNRIPLIQNGTIDLECAATTNNLARQRDVSFGLTTFVSEVRMLVKANSGITSLAQLDGRKVAATVGTTSIQLLRKHERANKIDFQEIFGKDHSDSFLMLETGRADAMVLDDNLLAGLASSARDPSAYKIVGESISSEPIAIMFKKGDPVLKKAVDDFLRKMARNGQLETLYTKWFIRPIPPNNVSLNLPMNDTMRGLMKSPDDKPLEAYVK